MTSFRRELLMPLAFPTWCPASKVAIISFPRRTIRISKRCVVLVSTIYHPDEQCGVRLRRESPRVGAKGEAGCCQQQAVMYEIGRGGCYGGRAERGMKKFLNQGILAMGWFPRTGRDRYRVKVSGLADEVVRIRWEVREGGKDGSSSGFGGCYLGLERSRL